MTDYYSFLSPKIAEIAIKLDEVIQKRENLKQEYLDKPLTKETSAKIHEDWELHNLEWQYHNQLVPLLGIKVETRAISN